MRHLQIWHPFVLLALATLATPGAFASQESIPITASLDVHFEASDGTQGPAQPLRLVMVNPPSGLSELEVKGDLSALFLSADCRSKQVRVHDQDSTIDSGWESVQSDSFEMDLTPPSIEIADDGQGHRNCNADLNLHIRGKIDCRNPAAPGMSAEIAYQLRSGERSPGHLRGPWKSCSFPQDAYLYGRI